MLTSNDNLKRKDISNMVRALVPMNHDYLEVVWGIDEFNRAFEVQPNPTLYAKLVVEETNEWLKELIENGYSENLLKETVDVLYVAEGLLAANPDDELLIDDDVMYDLESAVKNFYDIILPVVNVFFITEDIMEGFDRVQTSNMSKLGEDGKPIRRADNKVLKGPNYKPADLSDVILTEEDIYEEIKA